MVILHFNLGSKAFPSPFRLFLLLDFLLEWLCSVAAELVAKGHIFRVTCGTAVSGVLFALQWPKHNALKIQP